MADDLEALRNILQLFTDIVTEVPQLATATRQQSPWGVCVTTSRLRCSGSGLLRSGRGFGSLLGEARSAIWSVNRQPGRNMIQLTLGKSRRQPRKCPLTDLEPSLQSFCYPNRTGWVEQD